MCGPCAQMDWTDAAADPSDAAGADLFYTAFAAELLAHKPQHSRELEHLLESDQPTVVECFKAEEQAQQAISEMAAQEPVPAESQETSLPAKPALTPAEHQRSVCR